MKMISWLLIALSVWMISCQKDDDKKVIPTEVAWGATQKVRINKVNFTKTPNFFWSFVDSTFTIYYIYNELGELNEIRLSSDENSDYYKTIRVVNNLDQKNSFIDNKTISCSEFAVIGFEFVDNIIKYENNKVVNINGRFNECLFGNISLDSQIERNALFSYVDNGLLESINSFIKFNKGNIIVGTELRKINYDNQYNVKSFEKVNRNLHSENSILEECYTYNMEYSPASEVPDDLKRKLNQGVIGFNMLGLEEYLFNINYINPNLEMFSDWLISFGLPTYQSIPAQNIGIISSKRTVGKSFLDFVDGAPVYQSVDSTATFPYTHDPVAKTLEIAGLKIWYKVLE